MLKSWSHLLLTTRTMPHPSREWQSLLLCMYVCVFAHMRTHLCGRQISTTNCIQERFLSNCLFYCNIDNYCYNIGVCFFFWYSAHAHALFIIPKIFVKERDGANLKIHNFLPFCFLQNKENVKKKKNKHKTGCLYFLKKRQHLNNIGLRQEHSSSVLWRIWHIFSYSPLFSTTWNLVVK